MIRLLKSDIPNLCVKEEKFYKTYCKKDLTLCEDGSKNTYVTPSSNSNSSSSLSSDLSKSKSNNPSDDEFIFNTNSYDNNSNNDNITLDITATSPSDASQKYNKMIKQPQVRSLIQKGNVMAKVHMNNESRQRLRNTSVDFTKTEFNQLLKL